MYNVELPHTTVRRNSNGTERVYFFRRGVPLSRLPDPSSPLFEQAYRTKLAESDQAYIGNEVRALAGYRRYWANQMFDGARYRPNRQCHLNADDIERMLLDQGDCCALSGIRFNYRRQDEKQDPMTPSLDRIDSGGEYTVENCRVVLLAVNVALNRWGDAVFKRICRAVSKRHPISEVKKHSDV